jgi:hypothetical protein
MQPAICSAMKGIQRNINRLNESACRLSRVGLYKADRSAKPVNIAKEMVDCMAAEKAIRANIESLRTALQMTGTIINIKS